MDAANFTQINQLNPTTRTPTAGKMRGPPRSRPVSSHHGAPSHTLAPTTPATRKVFNTIVDDSALVAGVKRSTRNGIRQWVKNGQIRLFVPLHALEQLSRQKSAGTKHGEDVRETLQWLDDVTSKYPQFVTLQGGDQYYQNWSEVERFAVPRTLFSENDHLEDAEPGLEFDDLPEQTATKLTVTEDNHASPVSSAASVNSGTASLASTHSARSSISPVSPPTSPAKAAVSPNKATANVPHTAVATTSSGSVPLRMQSLFNYILWRIYQELDPIAALETFIFLCNDPRKSHYAKGFDIRCKRLEQLREAVGREDRDFRNRMSMQNRENQQALPADTPTTITNERDDDEVVYKPPPRGPAAMAQKEPTKFLDPHAFGRTPPPQAEQPQLPPKSPRFSSVQPPRGGPILGFPPRGNGIRGNIRGSRGRGTFVPGRGGFAPNNRAPDVQQTSQIDPDSFARPRSGGFTGRGTRKLWVPT